MFNLLRTGKGFTQFQDGSINPNDDLLRICPLHRVKGVYGCIARFEVQSGLFEFESTSVLSIESDEQINNFASGSWAQSQRTASLSFVQAIRAHSNQIRNRYHVNTKNRKAFVVSQDVPWSEAEFVNDPTLSYLQYPQVFATKVKFAKAPAPFFPLCSPDTKVQTDIEDLQFFMSSIPSAFSQ